MPRHSLSIALFAMGCLLVPTLSVAQDAPKLLLPGDPAPPISIRTWLKGTPVRTLPAKGIAIVEFWATWCGPCRKTIPHLTKLAKANRDITVLGVGIWEDNDGKNLRRFLNEMGAQMEYLVGYSGNQDGMASTWMAAAKATSIPTAFLIQDRKIAWIGHPDALDSVLAKVRTGTWDVSAARQAWRTAVNSGEQRGRLARLGAQVYEVYASQGPAAAVAKIRANRPKLNAVSDEVDDLEIAYLAEVDWEAWTRLVRKTLAKGREETRVSIVDGAWRLLRDPQKQGLAVRILEFGLSVAGTGDFTYTFTAARAFEYGKMPIEALKMLDLAERVVPKNEFEDQLRKRIADMRANLLRGPGQ